jgi:hypothetical protein
MLRPDVIESLNSIKENIDNGWDELTKWEKKFVEDFISKYEQYGKETFVSARQLDILLSIGEKIL